MKINKPTAAVAVLITLAILFLLSHPVFTAVFAYGALGGYNHKRLNQEFQKEFSCNCDDSIIIVGYIFPFIVFFTLDNPFRDVSAFLKSQPYRFRNPIHKIETKKSK